MMRQLILLVAALCLQSATVNALTNQNKFIHRNRAAQAPITTTPKTKTTSPGANAVAAATIVASSLLFHTPAALADGPPRNIELSTGAFSITTSSSSGQSLLRTEIDSRDFLTTLFKNRKGLQQSVQRISSVVAEELNTPAVQSVTKQLLQIEGDVVPEVKLNPPSDWQQTVKDISKGKLDFIVNGEIINLSVKPEFSEYEDEIVLSLKGFRGVPTVKTPTQEVVHDDLQDKIKAFWKFWDSDFEVGKQVGLELTNGLAILGGSASGIAGIYAVSYAYYLSLQEQAAAEAAEKKAAMAAKKAAAAAKKKAAKEKESGGKAKAAESAKLAKKVEEKEQKTTEDLIEAKKEEEKLEKDVPEEVSSESNESEEASTPETKKKRRGLLGRIRKKKD